MGQFSFLSFLTIPTSFIVCFYFIVVVVVVVVIIIIVIIIIYFLAFFLCLCWCDVVYGFGMNLF